MKYNVITPDGIPITCFPFNSEQEARDAIPLWCKQFEEQGYYLDGNLTEISLDELPDLLAIEPADW